MELTNNPNFQMYAASTIVLGLNLLVLANSTALTRAKAGEMVNPEDSTFNPNAEVVYEGGNAKTARFKRAHRNALENIPLFLITGFLLSLTSVSSTVAGALFSAFVLARLAHSITYVAQLQPWRTISFAAGIFAQLGLLGVLGYTVFIA